MEELFIEKDVDFKEMYLKMVRATEEAIRLLIEVQQECEEMYTDATKPLVDELRSAYQDPYEEDEEEEDNDG